jgi:hypothetical protein
VPGGVSVCWRISFRRQAVSDDAAARASGVRKCQRSYSAN